MWDISTNHAHFLKYKNQPFPADCLSKNNFSVFIIISTSRLRDKQSGTNELLC